MSTIISPAPLTPLDEPASLNAAHEDAWIGYYTGQANEINYRYLFEVYINAVRVSRLAIRPSVDVLVTPDLGVGYCNIRPIISSYVPTNYFTPPAAGARSAITPYVEYYFKVSDVYNDASGNVCGQTVLYDSSSFGNIRAYNASRKYKDQVAGVYSTQLNKFQTARVDTNIKLSGNENFFMTAFYTNFVGYRLKQYNEAGTLLSTDDVNATGDCIINCKNIAPGISGSTKKYTVQLYTNFGTNATTGDLYTFTLDCGYPKHTTRTVHFMNRLGGYDTAYFRGASRKEVRTQRQRVQVENSQFTAGTLAMERMDGNKVFYGGARDYAASTLEVEKLTTEFLNEQEYEFYADLLASPAIYLEVTINGTVHFVPYTITQESIEIRKRGNEGLTALEMEMVPAHFSYTPTR